MGLRLYGIGKAPNGTQYNASIYDTTYSGSDSSFDIARNGIQIEWKASEQEDLYSPIYGSVCTIDMLVPVSNSTLTTFISDVRTSNEGRFHVEITTQAGAKIWRGILTPDALTDETDEGPIFTASLTAICGLAALKTVPYYNSGALYTGRYTLIQHILTALGKLSHVPVFWGADDAFLETSLDWWSVGMTAGGANDPLNIAYCDHSAFYDFKTKGGTDKDVLSCYDVLRNICTTFGARIRMRDGMYVVEQLDYRANTTYEYRRYKKGGAAHSNASHSGVITVNQTKTSGAKLSFVTYDYQSQLAKAQQTYEVRLRRNFWQNIVIDTTTTFNFNQTISANAGATTMRIRGTFFITLKNNTYSGSASDILIPEMKLKLKIGDRYLDRTVTFSNFSFYYNDAVWSTDSSKNMSIVAGGQKVAPAGSSAVYVQGFDFITPAIPADGLNNSVSAAVGSIVKNDGTSVNNAEFTITWSAGGLWLEIYDQGTPDVQEDEVLYEADNSDGGTDTWECVTRVGGGSLNYLGALMNSDASSAYSAWGQGSGTRDKALGSILVKRVQDFRLRPKKRLNGSIYTPSDIRRLLRTSDTLYWLDMRLKWQPTENIVEGTWVEADWGTTGNIKTPIKVKVLTGGTNNPTTVSPGTTAPTTGGNQGLVSNPPGAILTPLSFNSLSTAITKGATVTSIAVSTALAGNEFSAGDKVKLVNPVTGQFQTFTVASAPSVGATSISVNSATADFDIPSNAGLFVQLTPQAGGGGVADGDKGDITVSSGGTVWSVDNNAISNAKIRQSAGLSVIGRSANTTGDVADLTAGTDGHVLRRSGTTLGFGEISTAGIANNAVTNAKIRQSAAFSVVGRASSTTGDVADITATAQDQVLVRGASLQWQKLTDANIQTNGLTGASIADNGIGLAKLSQIPGLRLIGNGATVTGNIGALTPSSAYTALQISGQANRVAFFGGIDSISSSGLLTFSNNRLNSNQYINGSNSYSGSNVAFDTGAGTGPTTDSITGGGNWIAFTFTTGTSPAASATVATITIAQSFPNETCPISSAGNANAAGQMTNFFTEATTTTITLKVTTALAASTQYIVRFNLFGR